MRRNLSKVYWLLVHMSVSSVKRRRTLKVENCCFKETIIWGKRPEIQNTLLRFFHIVHKIIVTLIILRFSLVLSWEVIAVNCMAKFSFIMWVFPPNIWHYWNYSYNLRLFIAIISNSAHHCLVDFYLTSSIQTYFREPNMKTPFSFSITLIYSLQYIVFVQ